MYVFSPGLLKITYEKGYRVYLRTLIIIIIIIIILIIIILIIIIIIMKTLLNFLRIYTIVNLTTDLGNLQLATWITDTTYVLFTVKTRIKWVYDYIYYYM
jgi:hypothetical protein